MFCLLPCYRCMIGFHMLDECQGFLLCLCSLLFQIDKYVCFRMKDTMIVCIDCVFVCVYVFWDERYHDYMHRCMLMCVCVYVSIDASVENAFNEVKV